MPGCADGSSADSCLLGLMPELSRPGQGLGSSLGSHILKSPDEFIVFAKNRVYRFLVSLEDSDQFSEHFVLLFGHPSPVLCFKEFLGRSFVEETKISRMRAE